MTRAVPSPKPPARRGFLYRELAGRIADALRDGSYAVGDRQFIAITGGGDATGVLADISDAPMLWVFSR